MKLLSLMDSLKWTEQPLFLLLLQINITQVYVESTVGKITPRSNVNSKCP